MICVDVENLGGPCLCLGGLDGLENLGLGGIGLEIGNENESANGNDVDGEIDLGIENESEIVVGAAKVYQRWFQTPSGRIGWIGLRRLQGI